MPEEKSLASQFKSRIDRCKAERRNLIPQWQENVAYRRGKPFESASDRDRIAVPIDWSQTKAKQAQLFSQVPEVMLTPKQPQFAAAVPVFRKALNDALKRAKVGTAMDETLPDCINAAGIGGVIVSYESTAEQVEVPSLDPATLPPDFVGEIPTTTVSRTVDSRFAVTRISPVDLLWPVDFKGSDFDEAPWVGRTGRIPWAEAKRVFGLSDDQKSAVCGDETTTQDTLSLDTERQRADGDIVTFDEVFYWRHLFHADETRYTAIQRMVFVNGIEEPVVDEPWQGQRLDEQTGRYIGACRFPIRVLTLTYISDEAVPPSDSAIARPQVNELIRSRSQMVQQRDHSVPIRWFDINRVDPEIQVNLMQGDWQGMIPVQGDGSRAIGEVARAMYPREDFEFDRVAKQDLHEAWQVGPNQVGNFASGERSASEATIVQNNFQTRIGYERARVVAFFVGIAEVFAGLLSLYGEFETLLTPEEVQRLATWDRTRLSGEFVYSVLADSTVLLDAEQRIQRLLRLLNYTAKSGLINPKPIIEEIVSLSGLDPALVVVQPQPPKPDEPNLSFRFNGEDLSNPLALAMLLKAGQAPSPQELEAAKAMLMALHAPPMPQQPSPMGPPGSQPPPTLAPAGAPAPVPNLPGQPRPMTPPTPVQNPFPNWNMADRLNTRRNPGEDV